MNVARTYLDDVLLQLRRQKRLAERAMAQLSDEELHVRADEEANGVAVLVQHLAGNMRSRWTDFLTTDGEKPDRHRDAEFVDAGASRDALLALWEDGWRTCLGAIEALGEDDLLREVTIRGEPLTVLHAIQRQLGHYAYHVGQIVQLARATRGPRDWQSLSIPRGGSDAYRP